MAVDVIAYGHPQRHGEQHVYDLHIDVDGKAVDNPQTQNDIKRYEDGSQPVEIDIFAIREVLLDGVVVARDLY